MIGPKVTKGLHKLPSQRAKELSSLAIRGAIGCCKFFTPVNGLMSYKVIIDNLARCVNSKKTSNQTGMIRNKNFFQFPRESSAVAIRATTKDRPFMSNAEQLYYSISVIKCLLLMISDCTQ